MCSTHKGLGTGLDRTHTYTHTHTELFRSTFQSSNPIGQYIIHNYMHQPKLTPNPTLINRNPTNQIKALKCTLVL